MRSKQRYCHRDRDTVTCVGVSVDLESKQDVYGRREGISERLRKGSETRALSTCRTARARVVEAEMT